jgi:hypothetical protein
MSSKYRRGDGNTKSSKNVSELFAVALPSGKVSLPLRFSDRPLLPSLRSMSDRRAAFDASGADDMRDCRPQRREEGEAGIDQEQGAYREPRFLRPARQRAWAGTLKERTRPALSPKAKRQPVSQTTRRGLARRSGLADPRAGTDTTSSGIILATTAWNENSEFNADDSDGCGPPGSCGAGHARRVRDPRTSRRARPTREGLRSASRGAGEGDRSLNISG